MTKCAYNSDWFNKTATVALAFSPLALVLIVFSPAFLVFSGFSCNPPRAFRRSQNDETTNESLFKFMVGLVFIIRLRSAFLFLTSTAHMCANKRARRSSTSVRNIAMLFVPLEL